MKAILIYPYEDDPDIVRLVLIDSNTDEQRLRNTLQQFAVSEQTYLEDGISQSEALEKFLNSRGFNLVATDRLYWPFRR